MLRFLVVFCSLVSVGMGHPGTTISCPVLPSGKCWLDCNRVIHEIVCEETHWAGVHQDLKHYASNIQPKGSLVELVIWNSPEIVNVDTNLLSPILDVLQSVALQNLVNLRFFPMLRDATKVEEIMVDHCEQVTELDLSHLPKNLKTIRLSHTGIQRLEYVSDVALKYVHLTTFTIEQANLTSIRGGFFKAFPALTSLHMWQNVLKLDTVDWDTFATDQPLNVFQFSDNDLICMTPALNSALFRSVLDSLNLQTGSYVDLSENNFRIDEISMANISRLVPAISLSLRGNYFLDSIDAHGLFSSLVNLKTLDVGNSNFPTAWQAFKGLPKLDTLRMDKNYLPDLSKVDMWADSESHRLRTLELEGSKLQEMPSGTLPLRLNTIENMNLAGNKIQFPEITANSEPISFVPYPALKVLNLNNMGLISFTSKLVQPLKKLTELDISCNPFDSVTKEFFSFLANDLTMLTMDLCLPDHQSDAASPLIADDAFSAMRPVMALRLNNGFYREGIFTKLNRMPPASKVALRSLSLDRNGIRYFDLSSLTFSGFTQLQYLSLKNNQIQTVTMFESADPMWKNLVTLDLSDNLLTVLREANFRGMDNLKSLYLGGNKLLRLADGCMDSLKFLDTLLLQDNLLREMPRLYRDDAGIALQVLGLERNPLEKISKTAITQLKSLKKLYLHQTKIQSLPEGILDSMNEGDGHVVSFPRDTLSCSCGNQWIKKYINRLEFLHFVSSVVENPGDVQHKMRISHVPKCRHAHGSFSFITESFECVE